MTLDDHSAPGSNAGFNYQFERALYWLARSPAASVVGIETDDGVAVRVPRGLLEQDKHSINATAKPFGDRSKGLWNTLAIWTDALDNQEVPDTTRFLMVTNRSMPKCIAKQIGAAISGAEVEKCVVALQGAAKNPPRGIASLAERVLRVESRATLKRVIQQIEVVDASQGSAGSPLRAQTISHLQLPAGESGSGKSALTWIIDYCPGSDKCSIPVGLIRDVTGWFGLHLKLANTEMIVARRNPENQQSTGDLYWLEGLNLQVPLAVDKNARVEDLKNRFNQISHLSNLEISPEENVGSWGRASSRDMAAFNFQPQP